MLTYNLEGYRILDCFDASDTSFKHGNEGLSDLSADEEKREIKNREAMLVNNLPTCSVEHHQIELSLDLNGRSSP